MGGEIEVQSGNAETPNVHSSCLAFCKLQGDFDIIRKSPNQQSDAVLDMEASFPSELDEIQLGIAELGNTHRHVSIAGRSPGKLSSGYCAGETMENTDSGCQAEAKQSLNMVVAVQECSQRLGHVELDILHVKDEIKAQAAALEVIQYDYQVQQILLKQDGNHNKHHEVKMKASNHGTGVEIKARHQDREIKARRQDRALHRKTFAVCFLLLAVFVSFTTIFPSLRLHQPLGR